MPHRDRLAGLAVLALAIAFNIPFALLASRFSYPDILRQPVGEVLDRFAAGGPGLVLTWHAFMAVALAFAPVGLALVHVTAPARPAPVLRPMAGMLATLAAITQAIGLARWVFAVPALAHLHADPAASAETRAMTELAFTLLHDWAGIGIGEHLGQALTAGFLFCAALLQRTDDRRLMRLSAPVGLVAAALIAAGLADSLLLALGATETAFAGLTVAGFLVLTLWLVGSGIALVATSPRPAQDPALASGGKAA